MCRGEEEESLTEDGEGRHGEKDELAEPEKGLMLMMEADYYEQRGRRFDHKQSDSFTARLFQPLPTKYSCGLSVTLLFSAIQCL